MNFLSRFTMPLTAMLALSACSGGDSTAGAMTTPIDESGGVAMSADGLVTIELPAGAVEGETSVTIEELTPPGRDDLYTGLYDFRIDGELLQPVTVEMELMDTPPSDANIQLARFEGGEPESVGASVVEDGVLIGQLTSFSPYGGFDLSASEDGALEVSGDVSEHYEGEGARLYNFTTASGGSTDLAEGMLQADGTFTFELMGSDVVADAAETPAEAGTDGFRGLVCLDEVTSSIDPGAAFLAVQNLFMAYSRDDGSTGARVMALSTRTSGQSFANASPLPGTGTERQVYVYWLYTTHAVSVEQTCSDGQINLELNPGWNEVIFDNTDRDNRVQRTGERPAEVDWYLEPENAGG